MRNGFDMLRPSGFGERGMFLSHSTVATYTHASRTQSLARKAVILCIEGMKNPAHSNEMLRIVLDLAMVHQSVLNLTFRRPVPERPEAVRCISHCCSLLIRDVVMTNEGIITAVDRITPDNRRVTRTTG